MSKAKELVEILDRMSSEWVTSNEEEDAFHVANAVLVAGVVAEAREPLRTALEQIVACDYRGNEPTEQRIARLALATAKEAGG